MGTQINLLVVLNSVRSVAESETLLEKGDGYQQLISNRVNMDYGMDFPPDANVLISRHSDWILPEWRPEDRVDKIQEFQGRAADR